jgi:hypothetical protein
VRVYTARLPKASLNISMTWPYTDPEVKVAGDDRSKIVVVFEVFETAAPACKLPEPPTPPPTREPKPVIFIGHGRSPLWRYLKDHLQDKHGYQVEAYEIGARAGHAIRDILEDMQAMFLRQMINRKDILRTPPGNNLDQFFPPLQISASAITTGVQNKGPRIGDGADMDKAGF